MIKSEFIGELAKALNSFQGELKPAKKDSVNPFYQSKYADLASIWDICREPLAKNGLSLIQMPKLHHDDKIVLSTVLLHTSGEWLGSELLVTPMKLDPQSVGSALTYARRYAMSAMLGVAVEDDDAEAASGRGLDKSTVGTKSKVIKEATPVVALAPEDRTTNINLSPVKTLGDLYTRAKDTFGMGRADTLKLLGVEDQMGIGDLNEAWAQIVAIKS